MAFIDVINSVGWNSFIFLLVSGITLFIILFANLKKNICFMLASPTSFKQLILLPDDNDNFPSYEKNEK